jgi:hypothetical protein
MSRGQLMTAIAALALCATAPRVAAQDTSSTGRARPDTSGYRGGAGVDTSARPGRVGAIDTTMAPVDSLRTGRDSLGGGGAGDTSGMGGRQPDSTRPGDRASPRTGTGARDSASVAKPTKEAEQSTSRTGDSAGTGSP